MSCDCLHPWRAVRSGLTAILFALVWLSANLAWSAKPAITTVVFSPEGSSVLLGSQSGVRELSWPGLQLKRSLPTKLLNIHDLQFVADGSRLVVAGGLPAESGGVEVYSWPAGELVAQHRWHRDLVFAFAWSAARQVLVTAGLDGVLQVHGFPEGQLKQEITGHSKGVTAIVVLDKQGLLVSGGLDHSIRVWDVKTGDSQRTLNNHTRSVHDLAVRPGDSKSTLPMVASVSTDRTVRFWQPTIGRMVRFLRLARAIPLAVEWLPDGNKVVIACSDGHLRIVDPVSVEVLHDLPALSGWAYSLAVAPDAKSVLIAGEQGEYRKLILP